MLLILRGATDVISGAPLFYGLLVALFLNELHGLYVALIVDDAGDITCTTLRGADGLTSKVEDLRFEV